MPAQLVALSDGKDGRTNSAHAEKRPALPPRTRKKMCIVKGEEGMPFLCLASFPSYATLKGGGGSQYVPPGRGGGSFLEKKKGERRDGHDQTGVRYTMAAIYRKRSTSKAESRFVAPSYSHSPIFVLPVLF